MKFSTSFYLLTLGLCFNFKAISQSKDREIGLKTSNLQNYNLLYKHAKTATTYRRLSASLSSRYNNSSTQDNFSLNGSFSFGLEKRQSMSDKFMFLHGFFPTISMSFAHENILSINPGFSLGYIIGFQYDIGDKFVLGTEIIPNFAMNCSFINYKDKPTNTNRTDYTISSNININSSAGLFLIYKLNR